MSKEITPSSAGEFSLSPTSPGAAARLGGTMPPPQPEGGVPWNRYKDSLRRHKWLVLLITVAGTALGFFVTSRLTPQYTAQATIWVAESSAEGAGPIRAPGLLRSVAWIELVNSYAVLNPVVQKMALNVSAVEDDDAAALAGLTLAPEFTPGRYRVRVAEGGQNYVLESGAGTRLETGSLGDSIGRAIGLRWAPPAQQLLAADPVEFRIRSARDAANGLRTRLKPQMAEGGNFLRLTLEGDDPEKLTETLNTVAEEFVAVAADLKKQKLTESANILQEQLGRSEGTLRSAESALEGFRVGTITKPAEGGSVVAGLEITQDPVMANFFQQKMAVDAVRRDRVALQQVLAGIQRGTASVDAYYGIPSVQSAPELGAALNEMVTRQAELRALESRYTAEYEPVQNLRTTIQELRGRTIPQLTTALIRRLAAQEQQLGGQIAGAERELQQIPARTMEEARLRREVQIQDNLYNTLQARYEEARLAEASAIPDVRVLDPAVAPQAPSRDNAPQVLLVAFLTSLGAGLGSALLLGQADKRFRYPEQATEELGLAILGAVPGMPTNVDKNPEKATQMVEAFRSIRLNIAYSYGAAGPVIVAVSSPNSGDGKSFIASNLALSYADAGHRTLLVDGDIRQGDLHRTFRTDRRPGLTDYLAGNADASGVICATHHVNLSFIPSGTRDRRGPELLGSGATGRLFATLKNRFEVIVVDTPPLSAGVDPFILATATGSMVVVLRSGETDRKLAAAKLETVDQLPIRLLGAVLNDIRAEGAYRYYAYDYEFSGDELETGKADGPKELTATTS